MATAKEKAILFTSVVVLILGITIIGLVLRNTKNTDARIVASCPDYWYNSKYPPCSIITPTNFGCCADGVTGMTDASGSNCGVSCTEITDTNFGCCADGYTSMTDASGSNCPVAAAMCYNTNKLGDYATCMSQDFSTSTYTGSNSLCQKQTWAKGCKVSWDGITNVPNACGT
jgi:hypothetical protein